MSHIRFAAAVFFAASFPFCAISSVAAVDVSLDRTALQWAPFVEWKLNNPSHGGNPFDLAATAAFVHEESGEKRTTGMFYDGGDTWKFRFTATRSGKWSFTTRSADSDLGGHYGTVLVTPNEAAYGFVSHVRNTWVRPYGGSGELRAFVPQFVMYDGPQAFHRRSEKIDVDIQTFLVEHGFTGFHVPVFGRWFDLEQESTRGIKHRDPNPDPRTFEALELLITKVHAAGGVVHFWMWGDEQRSMTPARWGINGKVDRRLQRYLAARLGPLPGWTMGYGFDLDEWVNASQLAGWRDSMREFLGWPHMLGGRHGDPNRGVDHSSAVSWNRGLDYSSYEHHRPTYDVYVASLKAVPGQPVFSEDRFRIRQSKRYAAKDYSMEQTRRGLWHSTMAGGVANIWGNLIGPDGSVDTNRRGSYRYPTPHWIKTYAEFFRDRFVIDFQRNNSIADGVCLGRSGHEGYVFYKEDAGSLRMDLSKLTTPGKAVAVDALKPYHEVDIGTLAGKNHIWKAPYPSDWALAVGSFDLARRMSAPARRLRGSGRSARRTVSEPAVQRFAQVSQLRSSPAAFTNITESAGTSGPTEPGRLGGHGAMFADADGDGRPDLYITMIFRDPMPELFFRNLGRGRFVEEGRERGIADFDGGSHGACFADLDNDGDYDLFNGTTWDHVDYPSINNVFRNDGTGRFQNVTANSGIPSTRRWVTRGVLTFDMDGDGDLDLFGVTNYQGSADPQDERNEAYRNDGGFKFTSIESGDLITAPCGQGATDTDFDGDGDIDVIAANRAGAVNILQNDGNGRFTKGERIPVPGVNDPRGVAFADIDGDGDVDFAVGCKRSGNQLIRNDLAAGNWIKVKLISPNGQAGAFGAKTFVYVKGERGRRLLGMRESRSNNGYLGQDDPVLHFGVGPHESVDVVVTFLDGTTVKQHAAAANQTVSLDGRRRSK